MRRRARAAAALALAPLLAGAARPSPGPPPARIMSIDLCADQLLLALVPPARIASVTWLARDPSLSLMTAAARRTPLNRGLAEDVAVQRPDLVLVGPYGAPATRALLRRLHAPVLELAEAASFADIRRITRQVAAAVGESPRGEALLARMDAALARLAAGRGPPVRVAAWDGSGVGARPGSLYDAVLTAAGARNVAGEAGRAGPRAPEVEALLAAAPALLVETAPAGAPPDRRDDLARHPLVRRIWAGRVVTVPPAAVTCGGPFTADAALDLQRRLRAKAGVAATPLPLIGGRR